MWQRVFAIDRKFPQAARRLVLVVCAMWMTAGCQTSSNRFQTSSQSQQRPSEGLFANLRRSRRRVPAAPAPAAGSVEQSYAQAGNTFIYSANGQLEQAAQGRIPQSPPLAASGPQPGPTPGPFGGPGQQRVTETPRPGPAGSRLERAPDGPELAGTVRNALQQPEPQASIRVLDLSQNGALVAVTVADGGGRFRVINLRPGVQYQLEAVSTRSAQRLAGTTVAIPPDAHVSIEVDESTRPAGPLSGRRIGPRQLPIHHHVAREATNAGRSTPGRLPDSVTVETPPLLRRSIVAPVRKATAPPHKQIRLAESP